MTASLHSLKLGVNVDHVATLRQARGTPYPSPLDACRHCALAGAHSITVHLREDRRHIQDSDVTEIMAGQRLPVNLEMSLAPEIVDFAIAVRPPEACLVPEKRQERTTEGGLDVAAHFAQVQSVVERLTRQGTEVSLFIAPDPAQVEAAHRSGAPCVELHTGEYCDASPKIRVGLLDQLISAARQANRLGLRVNAGHGITVENLPGILEIPHLDTLNIGHSIVSRAVLIGMEAAVREMLQAMQAYRGGKPA